MREIDDVRRLVRDELPELDASTLSFFNEGWDYELWQLDGDLLLRLPKIEGAAKFIATEARLLRDLRLSVATPRPEHVGDGFFTYRKLVGVALEDASLSDRAGQSVAGALGLALTELHRFSAKRAAELGVPAMTAEGWRDQYRRMQTRAMTEAVPRLDASTAAAVVAFWDGFVNNDAYFAFEPCLIHGDFDIAHVLIDPARETVSGIIDFGDARVGDPALDFAGFATSGTVSRELVVSAYALSVDSTFRARAEIYRSKISPFHAVSYGVETGNEWLERGLEAIRMEFSGEYKH
jgi:aminoglycoside 2''-phosphotransferase